MEKPITLKARKKSRTLAMQALYQWSISGSPLIQIEKEFSMQHDFTKIDAKYFHELLFQIPKSLTTIDDAFKPHLDRDIDELNPVELTIIRLGTYELIFRLEIPYKVVLKEAVSITKIFGAEEGYKYVNAILDNVAGCVREAEIALDKNG
jgi:N utilization substance protein B